MDDRTLPQNAAQPEEADKREGQTGVNAVAGQGPKEAADAGKDNCAPPPSEKEEDAQTGEETEDDRKAFEELIRGKYRAQFAERVGQIVKERLKNTAQSAKRYGEILPALTAICAHYGVEATDAQGLMKALEADGVLSDRKDVPTAEQSGETGVYGDPETRAGAKEQYFAWIGEAKELKEFFPSFDLERELDDPAFRELLRAGVGLGTAYRVLHEKEILPGIIRRAGEDAARRVANSVAAGGMRPGEFGAGGKAPGITGTDVAHLSSAQRRELIRRAERGEKISF
ncbi:MAG: hypothetical protein IJU52_08345 [Clostridia bacterium]|nr:hypothetical protein [Clostridia bacterium]